MRVRSLRGDERGATLVEFAFLLPVFILFVFAVIDFGWAFAQNLDVKQGAREGGRIVAVNGGAGSGTTQCQSIQSQIRGRTQDLTPAWRSCCRTPTATATGQRTSATSAA
jgi:Flp pilus assembly protein TadG